MFYTLLIFYNMNSSIPEDLYHVIFMLIAGIKEGYAFMLWNACNIFKMKKTICLVSSDWNKICENTVTNLIKKNIPLQGYGSNVPRTLQNFVKMCFDIYINNVIIPSEIIDNYFGKTIFGDIGTVLSWDKNMTIGDLCNLCKNFGNPFLNLNSKEHFTLTLKLLIKSNLSYYDIVDKIYDLPNIINFFTSNPIVNPFDMIQGYENMVIIEINMRSPPLFFERFYITEERVYKSLTKKDNFDETIGRNLNFYIKISYLNNSIYKENLKLKENLKYEPSIVDLYRYCMPPVGWEGYINNINNKFK